MTYTLSHIVVEVSAPGGHTRTVLNDCSLRVNGGECVGIVGGEGAGKTTLLQVAAGLLPPGDGSVIMDDIDLYDAPRKSRHARRQIGFAFQFPEEQFFCATVHDELMYATGNFGGDPAGAEMRASQLLREFDLDPEAIAGRSPFSLSPGEARRVGLAAILVHAPSVLMLDEPTSGMDGGGREHVRRVLVRHTEDGGAAFVVSRDADFLAEVATRVVCVDAGAIAVDLPAALFFSNNDLLMRCGCAPTEAGALLAELRGRWYHTGGTSVRRHGVEMAVQRLSSRHG